MKTLACLLFLCAGGACADVTGPPSVPRAAIASHLDSVAWNVQGTVWQEDYHLAARALRDGIPINGFSVADSGSIVPYEGIVLRVHYSNVVPATPYDEYGVFLAWRLDRPSTIIGYHPFGTDSPLSIDAASHPSSPLVEPVSVSAANARASHPVTFLYLEGRDFTRWSSAQGTASLNTQARTTPCEGVTASAVDCRNGEFDVALDLSVTSLSPIRRRPLVLPQRVMSGWVIDIDCSDICGALP
jgi:hypothetical protein